MVSIRSKARGGERFDGVHAMAAVHQSRQIECRTTDQSRTWLVGELTRLSAVVSVQQTRGLALRRKPRPVPNDRVCRTPAVQRRRRRFRVGTAANQLKPAT